TTFSRARSRWQRECTTPMKSRVQFAFVRWWDRPKQAWRSLRQVRPENDRKRPFRQWRGGLPYSAGRQKQKRLRRCLTRPRADQRPARQYLHCCRPTPLATEFGERRKFLGRHVPFSRNQQA